MIMTIPTRCGEYLSAMIKRQKNQLMDKILDDRDYSMRKENERQVRINKMVRVAQITDTFSQTTVTLQNTQVFIVYGAV